MKTFKKLSIAQLFYKLKFMLFDYFWLCSDINGYILF